MTEKSRTNENKADYRTMIPNYSDNEIIAILKKRSMYEEEAADLAQKEAVKRGLINSEQDLFSDEFNQQETESKLFPKIERTEVRNKIRKSIARILLLIGAVPAVFGLLKIAEGVFVEGILLAFIGGVWIYAAILLMRAFNSVMINVLFIMLAASIVYTINFLLKMKGLVLMDFAIPVILYSLIIYSLFFLRRMRD